MLSDEEKKAFQYYKECNEKDLENYKYLHEVSQKQVKYLEILLNLIEKQSKEIDHQIEKRANQRQELAILNAKQIEFNKLVNTVNSYKGQFKRQQKEIEELKEYKHDAELTKVACCSAQNCEALNNCIKLERELQNADNKWKDKIKAKIEEVDYKKIAHQDVREAVKQVLQSLLEKEKE